MKKFLLAVIGSLLLTLPPARAQGPDDRYIQIINLIQEADALASNGQGNSALAKYLEAQTALQRFQRGNPEWNAQVVKFRLLYLEGKIAGLSGHAPAPAAPGDKAATAAADSARNSAPAPAQPAKVSPLRTEAEEHLGALKDQVQQLQADKTVLEAKLKEALAAQPAASDPRELAKAEERIKSLQKENDLLKVTVNQAKSRPAPVSAADTKTLEQAQQTMVELKRKLAEQTQKANALAVDAQTLANLRAENQQLKKKLAEPKAAAPPSDKAPESARQLTQAQAEIAALESDKQRLRLEKVALENRVKQLSGPPLAATKRPAPAKVEDPGRIQQLERDVAQLHKKLEATVKEASERQGKAVAARAEELENQLAALRARLQVFEARSVPYTPEELALFKQPETKLAAAEPNAANKSSKELPPGAAKLLAEAERYFADKRPDKAEQTYLKVLHQDENNVYVLANLAAIQLELGHLDDAEKHINQAVTLDPSDAYSLTVRGFLRFKQHKYDEALDALSRAAAIEPENAEIQNYLGLTLSQKGLRGPAEAALRKAIQIEPSFGSAHNNLAVIYLMQQPPSYELACWHYQKALASGHPRNSELEKMLDAKKIAEKGQ